MFSLAHAAVSPAALSATNGSRLDMFVTNRSSSVASTASPNMLVMLFSSAAEVPEWKSVAPTKPNWNGLNPCSACIRTPLTSASRA